MNRIIDVKALNDYKILVIYQNGEKRIKDMKPYLEKGVFKKLKNEEFFNIMRGEKLNFLHKILNILLFLFFIALIALFIILFLIIYSAKSMFSSFLGFIGIIPIQYLFEDENFYKDVLKIEDDIFD